jgi:haloacetate dehalogenase
MAATPRSEDKPTVVLVHGAFAESSSWNGVIDLLLADGFPVIAVANPLRAVRNDSEYLASVIEGIEGPLVLVGHSYGGVVITNAAEGHDRVAALVYRMALDHPDAVERLAVLDIVPTGEVWGRVDAKVARGYWHWSFLAQPAPLPERLIGGDPQAICDAHVRGQLGLGTAAGRYPPEVLDAYRRTLDDPAAVEAMCEDYRAGATIDVEHDDADREAGRRIACPTLVLWSARGGLPRFYPDVLDVWRPWAPDLRGRGIDGSHFLAEDCPETVASELLAFTNQED